MQQREQLTTTIGGVCENASCGGVLDGVVQNYEIMAITAMCIKQENNINALNLLDNINMPSLLGDKPQNII